MFQSRIGRYGSGGGGSRFWCCTSKLNPPSTYGCWVATPERAYRDLKHVGRCLDLVEIPDDDMAEMGAA